jgi:hypothetical protein
LKAYFPEFHSRFSRAKMVEIPVSWPGRNWSIMKKEKFMVKKATEHATAKKSTLITFHTGA